MEIIIKDKKYQVRYTVRALFIFERITGHTCRITNATEEFIFMYALISASNPGCDIKLNDFIAECDNNAGFVSELNDFLQNEVKKRSLFSEKEIANTLKKVQKKN